MMGRDFTSLLGLPLRLAWFSEAVFSALEARLTFFCFAKRK
jgi:hypothetical protein